MTISRDELAVFLFEQCQDRTASVAGIVQAVANKANVSPDKIDSIVRKYKQSGTGLERAAQEILGDESPLTKIVTPNGKRTWDANQPCPAITVIRVAPQIIKPNFTIHNGQVVTLQQEENKFNMVDGTIAEIASIPISKAYFDNRIKELFPDVTCFYNCLSDTRRVIERINGEGKVFDLSLLEIKTDDQRFSTNIVTYDGVLYSGYSMQTKEEIAQEQFDRKVAQEEQQARREKRLAEQSSKMTSLGFDKFDEPNKAYQVYCMLLENDENLTFDVSLLTEDNGGITYFYDEEEYTVFTENELSEKHYDQEVECVRDNPEEYAHVDACNDEMLERISGYSEDTYESDDGEFFLIKE